MLKSLKRSLGWRLLLTVNRLLRRSWAPSPRREIFIEPTSTCNLGCRFCTYEQNLRPRQSMDPELFRSIASQVEAMGFTHVYLTPHTGDVFMDKGLEDKLAVLEGLPGIEEVGFFTNLAAASPERLARLSEFSKLKRFEVSLYGADEAGFTATTRRPAGQFQRLLANLDALIGLVPGWSGLRLALMLRVGETFRPETWSGPLADKARHLHDRLGVTLTTDTEYDDWGGEITQADVAGLGIRLSEGRRLPKRGICIKALGQIAIHADGRVGACPSRDSHNALDLGDLKEQGLAEILSWTNPRYRGLLEAMDRGDFPDVCVKCGVYRSVNDPRWAGGREGVMTQSQALALIGWRSGGTANETATPDQAGTALP